jgi:hypothetical protein
MVPIEDYREKRGGQNIEDNDIDVRMSFDQGEHETTLWLVWLLFPPPGEP